MLFRSADAGDFMQRIEAMARELVKENATTDKGKAAFTGGEEKPSVGKCPRCGSPVHEGKKNFYCSNRECAFTMWKNDRFFEERKVTFTPKIAAALLKSGNLRGKGNFSFLKETVVFPHGKGAIPVRAVEILLALIDGGTADRKAHV